MSFLSRILRALQWRVDHWSILTSGWREDVSRLKPDGSKNYEFALVHVHCESTVWYARLLEWLAFDCNLVMCDWVHCLGKMPRFLRGWERAWDEDEPDEVFKLEEWYGDEWCDLWHSHVETPILNGFGAYQERITSTRSASRLPKLRWRFSTILSGLNGSGSPSRNTSSGTLKKQQKRLAKKSKTSVLYGVGAAGLQVA